MKYDFFNKDLKEIFISGLAYKFKDSFVLLPRHGKAKFSLVAKGFPINLFIRRISGDGNIIINGAAHKVLSQKSEVIIVNDAIEELVISRPLASVGEVEILGISFEHSNYINFIKDSLKKLKNYKNINIVNQEVLFSENSWLESADLIEEIVVSPPNAFVKNKNKITFKTDGKIIKLFVKSEAQASSINLFKTLNKESTKQEVIKEEVNNIDKPLSAIDPLSFKSISLFNKDKLKYIQSGHNAYLVLKGNKDFNLVCNNILSNKSYKFKINAKKNSGDGKLIISSPFFNEKDLSINVTNSFNDYYVVFSLNDLFKFETLQFNVKLVSATGEVMFSSIEVISCDYEENIIKQKIKFDKKKFNKNDVIYNSLNKKSFAIIIPSYKNEAWAEKNILSALNQNYDKFKILFTDDCSPDNTFDVVQKIVSNHKNKDKAILVRNEVRKGALENLYDMIHSCDDDDIVLTLDGDDWLADEEVLTRLNYYYSNFNIWLTYGQYKNYPDGGTGVSQNIPNNVITNSSYRRFTWCSSHLRTFYSWLFKEVRKEDLMYEGKFMSMTWDMAMMFPMLEMAGNRHKFISDILYVYNLTNPINDHKVNVKLQQSLDRLIRSKPKYKQLSCEPNHVLESRIKKVNIGLMFIATGKYDKFVQQLVTSADNYFFNDLNYNVNYVIFTDKKDLKIDSNKVVKIINIEHKKFPFASMDRFKHFTQNEEILSKFDYLYYIDVDSKFVSNVSTDVLGDLVGVRHCGYYNGGGTFEDNKKSQFYLEPSKYKYYFGGGFSGGKSSEYLKLSKYCYEAIEKDLNNNIMPKWHDETALNRYFVDHEPDVILTPSYHYPENDKQYFEKWKPYKFEPKIMLLNKNHQEIRE